MDTHEGRHLADELRVLPKITDLFFHARNDIEDDTEMDACIPVWAPGTRRMVRREYMRVSSEYMRGLLG